MGRGIKLDTSLFLTEEKISGSLSVNNPNFNYTGNAVFASFDVSSTDMSATSGYESSKTGFSLGTQFEQYQNIYFSPSITAVYEDIEVKDSASTTVKKMDGSFSNLDFVYGITVDRRNQAFQPTSGYRTSFRQSLPLLIDQSSIMNGLDIKGYHAFSEDVIGVAKFYGRAINGVNNDDVRLTSRLFLPARKLRGFNTRKVGPKDGEDWVGGNYITAIGFEAQLPNLLPESTRTDISVFLDSGNVWSVDYSDTIEDASKLRSAVGVSANVFTVIGPLTFTIAQDITKGANDETQTYNFRIGTSF